MAAYTLVVMTNPAPGREDEFNTWYDTQHLADVLRLDGFTSAQRFKLGEGHEGPHKYLALYNMECDDPAAALAGLTASANTPAMPISDAMDANVGMALYAAITPLVSA